jgi:dolichol-phosphate mannosyltransferase
VFADRQQGASKMSSSVVREALWRVTVWGAQARTKGLRALFAGQRSGR